MHGKTNNRGIRNMVKLKTVNNQIENKYINSYVFRNNNDKLQIDK